MKIKITLDPHRGELSSDWRAEWQINLGSQLLGERTFSGLLVSEKS